MSAPQSRPTDPIAGALRSSSRLALWVSIAATAIAAVSLTRFTPPTIPRSDLAAIEAEDRLWKDVDFEALPEVRLLQELVRIDSSHPDPDELSAAEFVAGKLAEIGVPATIERVGERRANLWAFLEGRRPGAIVLHSHLDVEPAVETEGWNFDPFGAEIDGPWIYGRGIYDMKSLAVAQLLAFADLAKRGTPPEHSILLLATSGEEIGSELGTRRILAAHPELVERMAVVLTEGGVIEAIGPREVKYWGIEFAQKRFGRIDLCSANLEQLDELGYWLTAHGKGEPVLPLKEPVRIFLESYGPTRGAAYLRRQLERFDATYEDPERFRALPSFLRSLARNEVVPFRATADPEGGYRLRLFLHLLPGADPEETLEELLPESTAFGLTRTPLEVLGADAASPIDHPVFRLLVEETRAAHPEAPVGPYFLPWAATDARFFRGVGLPAYGYSPFVIPVTDTLHVGGANERMALPGFVAGVALYRRIIATLADDTSTIRP